VGRLLRAAARREIDAASATAEEAVERIPRERPEFILVDLGSGGADRDLGSIAKAGAGVEAPVLVLAASDGLLDRAGGWTCSSTTPG